jgi:hypothetical protein
MTNLYFLFSPQQPSCTEKEEVGVKEIIGSKLKLCWQKTRADCRPFSAPGTNPIGDTPAYHEDSEGGR